MAKMDTLSWISFILFVVGGINWGLIGAFNFNLVEAILGAGSTATRVVYVLVGLAALYTIYKMSKMK